MVVTGAARSIVAKLFYQLGFDHPLFLTLLYLGGQALSLVPYNFWRYFCNSREDENNSGEDELGASSTAIDVLANSQKKLNQDTLPSTTTRRQSAIRESSHRFAQSIFTASHASQHSSQCHSSSAHDSLQIQRADNAISAAAAAAVSNENENDNNIESNTRTVEQQDEHKCNDASVENGHENKRVKARKSKRLNVSVSVHGLPSESRTEGLISKIPWYIKPTVPAFFNLLNSCMRWTSLLFVAASVAEMLITGMELVLSVLAARCVRGRRITWVRWLGVGVCTLGIILVGIFDTRNKEIAESGDDSAEKNDTTTQDTALRDQVIGILLILGQSIMSVIQDITEEVFMHEADFPPALLVGMEGSFGLVIALILYFPLAPLFGEQPSTVLEDLQSNNKIIGLSIGWGLLVTVTGIFNIAATGVTSSMTRNVWKNFRTCLIWIVSLIIFYATGNPELGEEWIMPGSFYILIGFAVMLAGVYVYYCKGARA